VKALEQSGVSNWKVIELARRRIDKVKKFLTENILASRILFSEAFDWRWR
jgi:hypothetical protein